MARNKFDNYIKIYNIIFLYILINAIMGVIVSTYLDDWKWEVAWNFAHWLCTGVVSGNQIDVLDLLDNVAPDQIIWQLRLAADNSKKNNSWVTVVKVGWDTLYFWDIQSMNAAAKRLWFRVIPTISFWKIKYSLVFVG